MVDGAEKLYWERRVALLGSGLPEGGVVTLRAVAVCVGLSVLYSGASSEAAHGVGCCLVPVT